MAKEEPKQVDPFPPVESEKEEIKAEVPEGWKSESSDSSFNDLQIHIDGSKQSIEPKVSKKVEEEKEQNLDDTTAEMNPSDIIRENKKAHLKVDEEIEVTNWHIFWVTDPEKTATNFFLKFVKLSSSTLLLIVDGKFTILT